MFWQVLFPVLILLLGCVIPSDIMRLMDVLIIFFCTIPDIDMVNLDRPFLQGESKWYSERHRICQKQKNEAFWRCNWYDDEKGTDDSHWWIWYSKVNSFMHGQYICTCSWVYIILIVNVSSYYPKICYGSEYYCISC